MTLPFIGISIGIINFHSKTDESLQRWAGWLCGVRTERESESHSAENSKFPGNEQHLHQRVLAVE